MRVMQTNLLFKILLFKQGTNLTEMSVTGSKRPTSQYVEYFEKSSSQDLLNTTSKLLEPSYWVFFK